MLNKIRKAALAIEPFSHSDQPDEHLVQLNQVLNWFSKSLLEIDVVSILNPDDLSLPFELVDLKWCQQIENLALQKFKKQFIGSSLFEKTKFHILSQVTASKSKTVKMFVDFATLNHSDLLIVHSRTKSFFKFSLGSFCEKLVHQSYIPILILPFEKEVAIKIKSILFPTDFSSLSKKVYQNVVEMARSLDARVRIYHRIARPIDEILQVAMHPMNTKLLMPSDLMMLSEAEMRSKAQDWIAWAKAHECEASFNMDSASMTLTGAILEQANKQRVEMIALPSHTSALNIPSLGSAVNQVLRQSQVPVLIIPVPYAHHADSAS